MTERKFKFKEHTVEIDEGHVLLVQDITDLRNNVMTHEYHDFKNTKYSMPKLVLRARLLDMAQAVVDGKYDN